MGVNTNVAARTGRQPSKVSRLENAKTPPSDDDVKAWCAACQAPEQAPDLIAASRIAEQMNVQWRRVQETGLRQLQESRTAVHRQTTTQRVYSSSVVPGLLQAAEYATALLTSITQFHGTPNDVDAAVKARPARSQILHEAGRTFALVIEESVLRHVVGDAATMAGQLGHILAAMAYPAVSIGVVPAGTPRQMWTVETFSVFDEDRAYVELLTAAVSVTEPREVAQYLSAFREYAALAVHGAQARALVTSAIDALGESA
ncbi:DUF5753 domain-containing protein [Streptomyces sp. NPDC127117]|uniref:DUF5753 domain-containing protein n=1 Tax=Streptomyces sp. NPDC127117 TaxID=3345368 RepID=UPI0036385FDA